MAETSQPQADEAWDKHVAAPGGCFPGSQVESRHDTEVGSTYVITTRTNA